MSSWEEIADQIAPLGAPVPGLATGANRKRRKTGDASGAIGEILGAERFLESPRLPSHALPDDAWNGSEVTGASGPFYLIDQPTTFFDPQSADLRARLEGALNNPVSRWLEGLSPEDLLFCDIETTGLSSAEPLFLIGTMRFIEGKARLQLFLARHPNEEKAILEAFGGGVRAKTLVTFNGKSFDWPFIEGRATRNLVRLPKPAGHFDLLFAARRRYRSQLPNCRLQTLEAGVCKRGRKGDIPSSRIPRPILRFSRYGRCARRRRIVTRAGDISLRLGRANDGRADLLHERRLGRRLMARRVAEQRLQEAKRSLVGAQFGVTAGIVQEEAPGSLILTPCPQKRQRSSKNSTNAAWKI